jgi:MFS family permease
MPQEPNHNDIPEVDNTPDEIISLTPATETGAYRIIPKVRSQFLAVLKIRNFMLFSLSQAISLFGDKLDYMALLAMVAFFSEKHGWKASPLISYLFVSGVALPTILFGPLAGVLVDRWNRLKVLIFCDSARTILVLIIPLIVLTTKSIYLICIVVFFVFFFGLFFNTARLSIIPNLVAKRRILAANSLMNFIGRIATFWGMFCGGLIVDWKIWHKIGIHYSWSAGFYIDALTYFISVVCLSIIAIKTNVFKTEIEQIPFQNSENISPVLSIAKNQEKKMFSELRFAYQYISQTPLVLFIFGSIILLALFGASAIVLLVPIIQGPISKMGLGLRTIGVGIFGSVGAIGLVVSSMSYGFIGHRINKQYTILIGFIVLGIVTILFPILKNPLILNILVFIAGLVISPIYITQDTILHEIIPESIRGRIFSTREWFLLSSCAVIFLIVGQLSRIIQERTLLYIIGILIMVLSVVLFFLLQRKLTRDLIQPLPKN